MKSYVGQLLVGVFLVVSIANAQTPRYEHGRIYATGESTLSMAIKLPDNLPDDWVITAYSEGLERIYRWYDVKDEGWLLVKLDYDCHTQDRIQPVWVRLAVPPCANCGVTLWSEKPIGEVKCGKRRAVQR